MEGWNTKKEVGKMNRIRIEIKPEEVLDYFKKHKSELEEHMHVIACTDTDDFNRKSFLYVTNENDSLFLSLEAPGTIVDSGECYSRKSTVEAVNRLLKELDRISPFILTQKYKDSNWNEYVCDLTYEMDKYLNVPMERANLTYLYDYGPRKDKDGKPGHIYTIRVPGATRGHIYLDNDDAITEIEFYKKTMCYDKRIVEDMQKYIGYQIIRGEE